MSNQITDSQQIKDVLSSIKLSRYLGNPITLFSEIGVHLQEYYEHKNEITECQCEESYSCDAVWHVCICKISKDPCRAYIHNCVCNDEEKLKLTCPAQTHDCSCGVNYVMYSSYSCDTLVDQIGYFQCRGEQHRCICNFTINMIDDEENMHVTHLYNHCLHDKHECTCLNKSVDECRSKEGHVCACDDGHCLVHMEEEITKKKLDNALSDIKIKEMQIKQLKKEVKILKKEVENTKI